ncbi:MAG: FKBP-type peptidyl-prolyl cis-trans isomerase [Myxococcota bacterium]
MGRWILTSLFLAACSGGPDATGDEAAQTENADAEDNAVPDTPADVAAPPDGAEKTESGLASKVLKAGSGTTKPTAESKVTVHYTGWTAADGERFDSSLERGQPATFPLTGVIAGWTEGLQLMVVGEKRRFWIPEELAYKGQPGKPAGMLTFDVELLEFESPPTVPAALEPPADAKKLEGGVSYVVIEPGTGTEKVTLDDTIEFSFAAWSADGKAVQSSFRARQTPRSRITDFVPSWQAFVQEMVAGQRIVAYVPEGYDKLPNSPPGNLIFDFTVKSIEKPVPAPADVAKAPADAKTTESGLAYKTLTKGEGPTITEDDIVRIHYTMWTADDGKMFMSTYAADQPMTGPARRMPFAGWTEALQLLSKGEKARVWIPESLALPNVQKGPKGPITMEIEVLEIITPPKPTAPPDAKAREVPAPK